MSIGGDVNNAGGGAGSQTFKQKICEEKIGQMVDSKNCIDAIDRHRTLPIHNTGIVNQNVDLRIASKKLLSKTLDLRLGGKISKKDLNLLIASHCPNG